MLLHSLFIGKWHIGKQVAEPQISVYPDDDQNLHVLPTYM